MALKIHRWQGLKRRLRATVGPTPLANEWAMLDCAREAGLSVPSRVAQGCRTSFGVVCEEALLTLWIPARLPLYEHTRAAAPGDDKKLNTIAHILVGYLQRIREAGLADHDFGLHNLLVAESGLDDSTAQAAWVDLESALTASPNQPEATWKTVAGALVSWWAGTHGNQQQLRALFERIQDQVPKPDGGWGPLVEHVNGFLKRRVAKHIRHNRVDRLPEPLEVKTLTRHRLH